MKFPVIPVSSGLIIQNNKVLIGLRSKCDNGGGLWEFPGGKIEINESSEEAVKRDRSSKPKRNNAILTSFQKYDLRYIFL